MVGESPPGPKPSLNERQPSDFSKFELLGMDKPEYPVNRGAEGTQRVSAIVAYLDKNPSNTIEILARYGLNTTLYDPETNPGGVWATEPAKMRDFANQRIANHIVLRLSGVTSTLMHTFFGRSAGALNKLSPAFHETAAQVDRKRATYAFDHIDEFPRIKVLAQEIEERTGIKPEELFKTTPALEEWLTPQGSNRNIRPIALQEALEMTLAVLKGENMNALATRLRRPPSSVTHFFKEKISDRLSQAIAGSK